MSHHDAPFGPVTPWPVWALGGLMLATLAVVAWQRWEHVNAPRAEAAVTDVLWQRSLRFEDRPNGDIAVIDPTAGPQGAEIHRFQGEQGFARGTLRALARARAQSGLGPQQPFVLTAHRDGRLVLSDPATGQRISLESFGPTNLAVFAVLRDARPVGSTDPVSGASR